MDARPEQARRLVSRPGHPGGYGGIADRAKRPSSTRLAERALRESWPVPEKIRGPLINRLAIIAVDEAVSPREATKRAKAIMAASKINLEAIGVTIQADAHEELRARSTPSSSNWRVSRGGRMSVTAMLAEAREIRKSLPDPGDTPTARRIDHGRRVYGPDHPAYRRLEADPDDPARIEEFRLDQFLASLGLYSGTAALRRFLEVPAPFELRRLELDPDPRREPTPQSPPACPSRGSISATARTAASRPRSRSRPAIAASRYSSGGASARVVRGMLLVGRRERRRPVPVRHRRVRGRRRASGRRGDAGRVPDLGRRHAGPPHRDQGRVRRGIRETIRGRVADRRDRRERRLMKTILAPPEKPQAVEAELGLGIANGLKPTLDDERWFSDATGCELATGGPR